MRFLLLVWYFGIARRLTLAYLVSLLVPFVVCHFLVCSTEFSYYSSTIQHCILRLIHVPFVENMYKTASKQVSIRDEAGTGFFLHRIAFHENSISIWFLFALCVEVWSLFVFIWLTTIWCCYEKKYHKLKLCEIVDSERLTDIAHLSAP